MAALDISVSVPDGIALGVLALFGIWGAFRGSLRQIGMLALAIGAILLATRFGPELESAVRKVITVDGDAVVLLAWATAYFAALVLGGVLLAILQPLLKRGKLPGERLLGGLLGVAHGAVLLCVVTLGLLLGFGGPDAAPWVQTLRTSRLADVAGRVGEAAVGTLPLPPALEQRLREPAPPSEREAAREADRNTD
jgi:uncharacterized membrane protein required for colicin V production